MPGLMQLAFDWLAPPQPVKVEPAFAAPVPAEPAFTHPRANRRSCLADTWVAYEFKRARRRTIGFLVGADGLVVRAPNWVALAEVESALQEKASWIVRKLEEMRSQQERLALARISWCDGAYFPYLGQTLRLQLDPSRTYNAHAELVPTSGQASGILYLGLSQAANADQIRDAVQAWLMVQARQYFLERMGHFAPLLQVQWRKLSLSQAGTRWGSAKSDGSIRLNWRLIHLQPSVIDYVVAHELSHLREMNHSPAFWDTVRSLVPNLEQQRQTLRQVVLPDW